MPLFPFLPALVVVGLPLDLPPPRMPAVTALVEARRRGDAVELERIARRLGAARLMGIAEGHASASGAAPTARARMAALAVLPLVDGAWAELGRLATLATGADAAMAEAAGKAATAVVERLSREVAYAEEMPPDVPVSATSSWLAVVRNTGVAAATRAGAVRAVLALGRLAGLDGEKTLAMLLADDDPEVRQAALTAAAPPAESLPKHSRRPARARAEKPEATK